MHPDRSFWRSPSSESSQSSGSSSSSGCDCVSPLVYCQLVAGFTSDHDKNSNKFFERHLHAECRSFLYPHSDPVGWANDSANRLLQFQRGIIHSDGNSVDTRLALEGVDSQRQYNLDATGNWVDSGFSGSAPAVENNHDCHPDQQSRTANNLNQIASIDGNALEYDLTGNLLGYNGLAFTFDGFKRLIGADGTGPDGTATNASYYYDAFRRRMRKVNNDTTMDFVPMGSQVLEERDGSNTLLRQFVWGQYVDELIQQREYENAPEGQDSVDWYLLTDLLYRSVALTDDSVCQDTGGTSGSSAGPFMPSFVEVYDTDVYGRTTIYKDPGPDGVWFSDDDTPTFSPKCRRIYTGREYEPETGLHYFNARYYHPDLGRFLSRDPIFYEGGMNLYAYCGGMPGTCTDPSGTTRVSDTFLKKYGLTEPYFNEIWHDVQTDLHMGAFSEKYAEGMIEDAAAGHGSVEGMSYDSLKMRVNNARDSANAAEAMVARQQYGDTVNSDLTAPGYLNLIPLYGSRKQALYEFATGHPLKGLLWTGMAVSDIFLLKSLATGVIRAGAAAFRPGVIEAIFSEGQESSRIASKLWAPFHVVWSYGTEYLHATAPLRSLARDGFFAIKTITSEGAEAYYTRAFYRSAWRRYYPIWVPSTGLAMLEGGTARTCITAWGWAINRGWFFLPTYLSARLFAPTTDAPPGAAARHTTPAQGPKHAPMFRYP